MTETQQLDPRILELFEFRPRKGDLKKLEIIQAAIDCIAQVGHENTTYEAIAQKLGTRRAHIAYHFSEKHHIFLAAVKYILGTYQQTLVDALSGVRQQDDGVRLLKTYVQAAYAWARTNPEQVQSMLLLYYLTTLHPEFKELHHQVRSGGLDRLSYLFQMARPKETAANMRLRAKTLQNLLSGSIIDAVTTNSTTLVQAQSNCLKMLDFLLE
jgi:AcrR family transcriptional regulator